MAQAKRKLVPIIDKKFQIKTTFSIIGVVSIISLLVVTLLSVNIIRNNVRIENILQIEDNLVHALMYENPVTPKDKTATQEKNTIDKRNIANNHFKNMQTLQNIMFWSKILLFFIIAYIFIQGILLFWILIRKTHRISGPIYVMSNYMRQIIAGRIPQTRPLRVKDELKEFYRLFEELVASIATSKKAPSKAKAPAKKTAKVKSKTVKKTKAKTATKTTPKK